MKSAILIISYKRPNVKTVKALKLAGYNGEWYIVADDKDETDYEGKYGSNKVIRFSKVEYAEWVDTVDNFGRLNLSVYARNFCLDLAKEKGWDYIGLFDDDIEEFDIRYVDKKSLRSKRVKNLNKILEIYGNFMVRSKFTICSFVYAGRVVGGAQNKLVQEKFYYAPTMVVIINMHEVKRKYIGAMWEDYIFSYRNNDVGDVCCSAMPIVFVAELPAEKEERKGSVNGGMAEIYKDISPYIVESYVHIVMPNKMKWKEGCKGNVMSKDRPRIISDKWRKGVNDEWIT